MEGDIVYYDDSDLNDYDTQGDAVNEEFIWDIDVSSGTVPIPYLIDSRMQSQELRENIHAAISEYRKKTCIR